MTAGNRKPMRAGFSRVFHASPADWTRADLTPLTGRELEILARLMAVPHSGTKDQTVARLLDAADLRDLLSIYDDDPQPLADHFKRTELVALARRAGTFFSLPKRGIAAAMSFPKSYHFAGNREAQVKQIGNSVAVGTARELCKAILKGAGK